jgi:hypothetical protein
MQMEADGDYALQSRISRLNGRSLHGRSPLCWPRLTTTALPVGTAGIGTTAMAGTGTMVTAMAGTGTTAMAGTGTMVTAMAGTGTTATATADTTAVAITPTDTTAIMGATAATVTTVAITVADAAGCIVMP